MKLAFKKGFLPTPTLALIHQCAAIVDEYMEQGYTLTVRQVFYQLVSANAIPNTLKSYKRIVVVLTLGRLYGYIDWDGLTDLTRNLRGVETTDSPQTMLTRDAERFRIDKWGLEWGQTVRPEVWVEKDALRGLVDQACTPIFTDYFSCRGYASLSAARDAGARLAGHIAAGQKPVVIYVGDHDFSGVHMTGEAWEKLYMFAGQEIEVRRVALNLDQVRRYRLPHQPGKAKDSRRKAYIEQHGNEKVWELDALKPQVLVKIIQDAVAEVRDEGAWARAVEYEDGRRAELTKLANRWPTVQKYLKRLKEQEPKRKTKKAKKVRTKAK